jgi:hypothetical protein
LLAGAVLALFVAAPALPSVYLAPVPPPWVPAGVSYSVAPGDPLTAMGVHPADIIGADRVPAIPCANLGLICTDPSTGAEDDVLGLSFGQDFGPVGLAQTLFTVDGASQGVAGSAVRGEAGCAVAEPQADVFGGSIDGANVQVFDGDGVVCAGNAGLPLFLTEGRPSDRLDDLDVDACRFVDSDCDGVPEAPVFFTLAPGSPTLELLGATSADVLMSYGAQIPALWASAADLGLSSRDIVDALCIRESGNGVFDSDDQVLFSLARGSPALSAVGASAADMLRPGSPPRVFLRASALGLAPTDNVSGMACAFLVTNDLYLPVVIRSR